jgi:hypothetical protein
MDDMPRPRHCPEANRVRRQLDAELAAVSKRTGRTLEWGAAERETLSLITDALDRKADLAKMYATSHDAKVMVKLAGEIRLIESHVSRLLKTVKAEAPAPVSRTSQKASAAARVRWDKELGRTHAG